jgi:hypothetical protein
MPGGDSRIIAQDKEAMHNSKCNPAKKAPKLHGGTEPLTLGFSASVGFLAIRQGQ